MDFNFYPVLNGGSLSVFATTCGGNFFNRAFLAFLQKKALKKYIMKDAFVVNFDNF